MTTERARRVERMAKEHAAAWSEGASQQIVELFAEHGAISVNGGEPHVVMPMVSPFGKVQGK